MQGIETILFRAFKVINHADGLYGRLHLEEVCFKEDMIQPFDLFPVELEQKQGSRVEANLLCLVVRGAQR